MQHDSTFAAQQTLKHDESLYLDLFNSAPDGFLVSDAKGVIQVANPAAVQLLGTNLAGLQGKSVGDFVIDKNQWQEYLAILSGQEKMRGSNPWEVQLKPYESTPFWASITSGITYCANGTVAGYRWQIRDISESKQIEDAQLFLLKSGWSTMGEDFFASLSRYLAEKLGMDYICIDRLDGDKLTAHTVAIYYDGRYEPNESYTLKDTPCGAVVGKTVCCFPEHVCQLFPYDNALQEMKAESYVGTTLWSSQGHPIGLIAIIGRKPLKNHKLAETILQLVAIRAAGELERREAQEVLRLSEETFSKTFHGNAAAMVLSLLDEKTVIDVNERWAEMTGYSREDIVGKTADSLGIWRNIADREAMIEELSASNIVRDRECKLVKKNGEEWIALMSAQIINVTGKQVLLSSCIDITQRKEMEETLIEADRAKDEFLAVLSHELQTPLTCILGWSAEAMRIGTPELMNKAMEVVHRNAIRQKGLIGDVLDMSRLTHRKINLEKKDVDLQELVINALEDAQESMKERTLSLEFAPCTTSLLICADARRIQQCIANLLNNSIRYTPESGVITVKCFCGDGQAVMQVIDTGRGIAAEALPKIFDVFHQVQRNEGAGGLGLGLTITRGLVELHDGTICIESAGEGKGCSSTIRLPLVEKK